MPLSLHCIMFVYQIYSGTFRDGKRDGRGVEYHGNAAEIDTLASSNVRLTAPAAVSAQTQVKEPTVAYRGEFFNDLRHGFGAAYYEEGQRYLGRFDGGNMSGVGLYMHPNGERYEGLFYNNKPDGAGSFYQKDPVMGTFTASHALWALGRKSKELTTPFEPNKSVDLPDDSVTENSLAIELAVKQYSMNPADFAGLIPDTPDEDSDVAGGGGGAAGSVSVAPVGGDVAGAEGPPKPKWQRLTPRTPNVSTTKGGLGGKGGSLASPLKTVLTPVNVPVVPTAGNAWKLQLAKYVHLTAREMALFGIVNDTDESTSAGGSAGSAGGDSNNGGIEEEVSMLGTHFLEVPPLYVAYVYVTTAAKIFEARAATREFQEVVPEFTAVNHLVIDAVDSYNDSVEKEAKLQMELKAQDIMAQNYQDQNAPKLNYKEQQLANANTTATSATNMTTTNTGTLPPSTMESTVVTATPIVKAQRKFSLKGVATAVQLGLNLSGGGGSNVTKAGTISALSSPSAATSVGGASSGASANTPGSGAGSIAGSIAGSGAAGSGAAKRMFMSDAEKKKDLVLKQRAELAAKKALKELPPELTRKLSSQALDDLERELMRLVGTKEVEEDMYREGKARIPEGLGLGLGSEAGSGSGSAGSSGSSGTSLDTPGKEGGGGVGDAGSTTETVSAGETESGTGNKIDTGSNSITVSAVSSSYVIKSEPDNEYAAELLNLLKTARSVT